jgi:hypothetical protein
MIEPFKDIENGDFFEKLVGSCHNILYGAFDLERDGGGTIHGPRLTRIVNTLNEASTPVHAIEAPPGLNVDTGVPSSVQLFASSTLSLGIPLTGLHAGSELVGRHYVCDISLPLSMWRSFGVELAPLFAEQPVVQLFPAPRQPEAS